MQRSGLHEDRRHETLCPPIAGREKSPAARGTSHRPPDEPQLGQPHNSPEAIRRAATLTPRSAGGGSFPSHYRNEISRRAEEQIWLRRRLSAPAKNTPSLRLATPLRRGFFCGKQNNGSTRYSCTPRRRQAMPDEKKQDEAPKAPETDPPNPNKKPEPPAQEQPAG